MKTPVIGGAVLAMIAGCGAPAVDGTDNEPASLEQGIGAPYRIAVIQMSRTNNTSLNASSFGTFTADFARIMQDKVYAAMDFYGPYHATPAQIGCNGNYNHDNALIETKLLATAQAAGVFLGQYRHIWFIKDTDLQPECYVGGSSGGHWFTSPGYGVNSQVGYVTGYSNNVVAMHEFLHGFYGPMLNGHLGVMSCIGGIMRVGSPSCTLNTGGSADGAPQTVWAMGTSGPTFGQPALFNENPVYKSFWNMYGILPPGNMMPIPQTVGSYTYTLFAGDGPIPPSGNWMTVYLPLPSIPGSGAFPQLRRGLWFEYRKTAQIGLAGQNRPGIYVYYREDQYVSVPQGTTTQPRGHLIRMTNDIGTQSGLGPLPKGFTHTITGIANVNVTVPAAEACNAATCAITVGITGPLQ
jgi:hypothetical protein